MSDQEGAREREQKAMKARVAKRWAQLVAAKERLERQIDEGLLGGEDDREWLDQFTQGTGLDICSGDFLIGDAVGLDLDPKKIGSSIFFVAGEKLTNIEPGSLDFIVCNYLDVMPHTLEVFKNWNRVLKVGGTLGLVVRNADAYTNPLGPLENKNRSVLFNHRILSFYLERMGFKVERMEFSGTSMRAKALKTSGA